MKRTYMYPVVLAIVAAVVLSACGASFQVGLGNNPAPTTAQSNTAPVTQQSVSTAATADPQTNAQPAQAQQPAAASQPPLASNDLVSAYQSMLENIYATVNPSVVSIHVITQTAAQTSPFFGRGNSGGSQISEGWGSGFVWDNQGDIVTNNHVIDGATSIDVTFADGLNVPAKLVGKDVYSDLAVIKVTVAGSELHPVTMGDASQIKVGELSFAIGNPYAENNSFTTGVISALNRSLPAGNLNSTTTTGPTYSIPDIIQTDTPINPGNSGGVLLDNQGRVLGVTSAIESSSNSNSGVGFAIPSTIVTKVIPSLIKTGSYQHPYIGITGTSLNAAIDQAMNLNATQQGALVEDVTPGSPAANAGLQTSNNTVTIDGSQVNVGGDVIIAINGQSIKSMDDLIAYLEENTTPGQKVSLTVLRNGKQMTVDLTLGTRPSPTASLFNAASDPYVDPNAELL
jgi:S1-C subfamily serine protease